MNPIFQRRYKSALASGRRITNSARTMSRSFSQRSLARDEEEVEDGSSSSSTVSVTDPNPSQTATKKKAFENEFRIKRANSSVCAITITDESSSNEMSAAESAMQSKQRILVQGSLSKAELYKRNRRKHSKTFAEDGQQNTSKPEVQEHPSNVIEKESPKVDVLELCDIEDEDILYEDTNFRNESFPNKAKEHLKVKLDFETAKQLRAITIGANGLTQNGWRGQGFVFSKTVLFGLIQRKGGPCGVLAVVQSVVIRNLFFGTSLCPSLPIKGVQDLVEHYDIDSSLSSSRKFEIHSGRHKALCSALAEILWRCIPEDDDSSNPVVQVCSEGMAVGNEVTRIFKIGDLIEYLEENVDRLDCLGLLCSAVLTRGIERLQSDMDFPDGPLIGQHGYCSQELINLLLFGKCISNPFDNEILLDGKRLRGITEQSDIGLLSLFEHYGSCEVGSFMKSPKYPIWIVCSESHFTVLFSIRSEILSGLHNRELVQSGFDLFYYDGLTAEQKLIRLTITLPRGQTEFIGVSKLTYGQQDQDHLIPPLEKCIQTKWKGAVVSWNETEPLL